MAREIPLSKGLVALVDDGDYDALSRHKWCAQRGKGTHYAMRKVVLAGEQHFVYMHVAIMGARPGMQIDHIDHDGLNNQRDNLRHVTQHGNMQNRRGANRNAASGQRNVYPTPNGTYNVKMQIGQKIITIGTFRTLDDAVLAAESGRRQHMTHAPENTAQAQGDK